MRNTSVLLCSRAIGEERIHFPSNRRVHGKQKLSSCPMQDLRCFLIIRKMSGIDHINFPRANEPFNLNDPGAVFPSKCVATDVVLLIRWLVQFIAT